MAANKLHKKGDKIRLQKYEPCASAMIDGGYVVVVGNGDGMFIVATTPATNEAFTPATLGFVEQVFGGRDVSTLHAYTQALLALAAYSITNNADLELE